MTGGRAFSPFTGRAFPLDHPSIAPAFQPFNAVWDCDGEQLPKISLYPNDIGHFMEVNHRHADHP